MEVVALEDDTEVVVAETEGIVEVVKVEQVQATVVELETLEVVAMEDMEGVEIQEGVEDLEIEVAEGGEQEDVNVTGLASCATT